MKYFNLKTQCIYLIVIFTFVINLKTYPQNNADFLIPHSADNWVFGNGTIVNFNNGNITVDTVNGFMFPNTSSTISDADGNLLMVSDGNSLWDKNFDTICTGLMGNNFASQTSLILPKPGSVDIYYVFTVDMYIPPVFKDGINYTIVRYDGVNDAEIILKNEHLLSSNAQKIAAVKHQNKKDYWIVTHGFGEETGGNFYSFLLTEHGLDTNAIVSTIGHSHNGDVSSNNGAGAMKISPDGSKLALVIPDDGYVEVFDFDSSTGVISNMLASNSGQFRLANGIEFSPDNSKVYFTITPNSEGVNYLYQIDLQNENPFQFVFPLNSFSFELIGSADSLYGQLQLATDGRIYASIFKRGVHPKQYIGVINNPNRLWAECNYNFNEGQLNNGLNLNEGGSLIGFSNFVSSFLDISPAYYSGQCLKDTTQIHIRNISNIDSVEWNFYGEGNEIPITDPLSPQILFDETGSYQFSLKKYFDNDVYEYNSFINIFPLPQPSISVHDTIYIPLNSSIILDAGDWDKYEWQPGGSMDRYLEVSAEGMYRVQVSDENCCKNTDSVYIRFITSVEENKIVANEITVFPNPVKETLNIDIKKASGNISLEICDMRGNVLKQEEDISGYDISRKINISDLPDGVYILKLKNKKGIYSKKFVKKAN